jgi:hypothetical protein
MEQSSSGETDSYYSQEIQYLLWNLKICYFFLKNLLVGPILSWMNPIHISIHFLSRICFNVKALSLLSVFLAVTLYTFLIVLLSATFPGHWILLYLITILQSCLPPQIWVAVSSSYSWYLIHGRCVLCK